MCARSAHVCGGRLHGMFCATQHDLFLSSLWLWHWIWGFELRWTRKVSYTTEKVSYMELASKSKLNSHNLSLHGSPYSLRSIPCKLSPPKMRYQLLCFNLDKGHPFRCWSSSNGGVRNGHSLSVLRWWGRSINYPVGRMSDQKNMTTANYFLQTFNAVILLLSLVEGFVY